MGKAYWTIGLCALASFIDGFDIQSLGLAIPGIAEYFNVPPPDLSVAVVASLVGTALGAIFLGPLGDRFSRKYMLVLFLAFVGMTSIGAATSSSPALLACWRFLCGLGMGAIIPVAIAIVSEAAPLKNRTALITSMIACHPLGSLCAGFASPYIEPAFGWQGIFTSGAVGTLAVAALIWLTMPFQPLRDATARLASVSALFEPRFRTTTILLWTVFSLNLFVAASLISWLPTLLTEQGWARADAQRATAWLAFGAIFGSVIFAMLIDRGLVARTLVTCFAVTGGLFLIFAVGPQSHLTWLILIALVGAGGVGGQMALGSFSATIYPPEIRATGIGWSSGVGRFGSIIGPVIMAAMLSAQVAPDLILAALVIPMLVCAVGVFALTRDLRLRRNAY